MPDREKVIKAIETHLSTDISVGCDDCTYENDGWCTTRVLADALALLKEQPEIVRCKDCVYHKNEKARSNQTAWLPCMEMQTKNNWYCADGVKKDE